MRDSKENIKKVWGLSGVGKVHDWLPVENLKYKGVDAEKIYPLLHYGWHKLWMHHMEKK